MGNKNVKYPNILGIGKKVGIFRRTQVAEKPRYNYINTQIPKYPLYLLFYHLPFKLKFEQTQTQTQNR